VKAAAKSLRHPRRLSVNFTTKKVIAIAEDLDDGNCNDDKLKESADTADLDDVKSWLINGIEHEGVYR
jgi:hypothetical protein